MKTMITNTALVGHTTENVMAERGVVPLNIPADKSEEQLWIKLFAE